MRGKNLLIFLILCAVVAGLCKLCLFTVYPVEIVIVTEFGNPVRTVSEPGLYFKLPSPVQTINRMDKRLQVFNTKVIQQLTADKKSVLLQTYCCWRINEPLKFLQSLGSIQRGNERLSDIVNSELGALLGNFELSNLITLSEEGSSLPLLEEKLTSISSKRALDLFGIEIASIGVRQLSLPAENARAVFDRMKAERSRDAARYRAEGEEIASGIQARAEREKAEILAKAYKEAEIIRGKADAEAARIYSEAYNRDLEFFDFLKSMEVYKKVLGSNSYLLVSSKSPVFRHFFSYSEGLKDPAVGSSQKMSGYGKEKNATYEDMKSKVHSTDTQGKPGLEAGEQ
jgi:membrane protease subunit HflC